MDRESKILNNINLVKKIAARISRGLPNHIFKDDLESAGYIGLINAVDNFDPDKKLL